MNPMWSYALGAIGVFGLYLAGKHDRRGWMLGAAAQILWLIYAIVTQQWGFIVTALAYGWVYTKNTLAWKNPNVDVSKQKWKLNIEAKFLSNRSNCEDDWACYSYLYNEGLKIPMQTQYNSTSGKAIGDAKRQARRYLKEQKYLANPVRKTLEING